MIFRQVLWEFGTCCWLIQFLCQQFLPDKSVVVVLNSPLGPSDRQTRLSIIRDSGVYSNMIDTLLYCSPNAHHQRRSQRLLQGQTRSRGEVESPADYEVWGNIMSSPSGAATEFSAYSSLLGHRKLLVEKNVISCQM